MLLVICVPLKVPLIKRSENYFLIASSINEQIWSLKRLYTDEKIISELLVGLTRICAYKHKWTLGGYWVNINSTFNGSALQFLMYSFQVEFTDVERYQIYTKLFRRTFLWLKSVFPGFDCILKFLKMCLKSWCWRDNGIQVWSQNRYLKRLKAELLVHALNVPLESDFPVGWASCSVGVPHPSLCPSCFHYNWIFTPIQTESILATVSIGSISFHRKELPYAAELFQNLRPRCFNNFCLSLRQLSFR